MEPQMLSSATCSQILVWLCSWMMVLHLFSIKASSASCAAPLQCVSAQNCSTNLGINSNSYTLFRCGDHRRDVCCPPSMAQSLKDKMKLLPRDICGISTANKVISGEIATAGQFPWMALLGFSVNNSKEIQFLCGGSVINDRYILTAAHCMIIQFAHLSSVRLGELNLTTNPDCEKYCPDPSICKDYCADPVKDFEVEEILVHERFNTNLLKNDIALIRLKRNITEFTDYIRPLCLPFDLNFTGLEEVKYSVAGWGKTDHYDDKGSLVLQYANIPNIMLDDCNALQAEEVRPIDETQLCAWDSRGRDACKGDSGGPLILVQNTTGLMYQVGVVSFGAVPCGGRDAPSVYTRVPAFLNWILTNVQP